MSQAKYLQYFQLMKEKNEDLFVEFSKVHDLYLTDPNKYQADFNEAGRDVVDAVRDWDRRLCSTVGKGQFSQYSQKLSEKFWDEVRKHFSEIDKVGLIIKSGKN